MGMGIIGTTMAAAKGVADKSCFAGGKGLWNFAPVDSETPGHVAIENGHLTDSLYSLAYHINGAQEHNKK